MKEVKFIMLHVSILISLSCYSQRKKQFVEGGLIRTNLSIAPGMLLKQKTGTISIHGASEFYFDKSVSLKNDVYYHVISKMNTDSLKVAHNHQLFVGLAYHFKTPGNFDPFVAFQPGVAYAQLTPPKHANKEVITPYGEKEYNASICPLLCISTGFNFYFFQFFHLFAEVRYVRGQHINNAQMAFSLDEIKGQFGLGVNLKVFHTKNRNR